MTKKAKVIMGIAIAIGTIGVFYMDAVNTLQNMVP